MSVSDQEFLKKLGINQAELGRLVRTSRQAVNIAVNKEETYFNNNRLLLLHNALFAKGDRRSLAVKELIETAYGIKVDHTKPHTISGSPDQFPTEAKEIWFFAENPLELTIPVHASLMRKQFAESDKTFVYFVGTPSVGHRLAQRLGYEIGAVNREGKQSAKIYIVLCTSMVMIMNCIFFNPRTEVKGYFKNRIGTFTMMPDKEAKRTCGTIMTAGVRVEGGKLFPQGASNSVLWNGLSFEALHEL